MLTPRSTALVLVLLLVPAGSAKAAPPPNALFSGGTIGPGAGNPNEADTHYLGARIGTSASSLTFFADVALKCGKHGTTVGSLLGIPVTVGADGTFSGTKRYSAHGPRGSEGGPITFSGRFVSDTRIT